MSLELEIGIIRATDLIKKLKIALDTWEDSSKEKKKNIEKLTSALKDFEACRLRLVFEVDQLNSLIIKLEEEVKTFELKEENHND